MGSDEKTRDQLEAELAELRIDLKSAQVAEGVLDRLGKKHGEFFRRASSDLKAMIFAVEIKLDPEKLAICHAQGILESASGKHTDMHKPSPGAVALAKAYLELKGEKVDA